jgi:hypothetical protein
MEDRIVGGIISSVLGDALGVPVEFEDREYLRKKNLSAISTPSVVFSLCGDFIFLAPQRGVHRTTRLNGGGHRPDIRFEAHVRRYSF